MLCQNHDSRILRKYLRAISNRQIRAKGHCQGDTNVQVRNVLAMVGAMPNNEFQYIKMLPTNRLKEYLEYFESKMQQAEIESISNWLVRLSM